MVVKGLPRTKIAIEMGMTYDGLTRIVRCPEYIEIENRVRASLLGKMDQRLDRRAKMEAEIDDAVPEAMQVLLEHVRKKRDLRAALEVLDREPTRCFAKNRETQESMQSGISSEALASALKEADVTNRIIKSVNQTTSDEKPAANA
jgi:hypothetical protein